MRYRLIRSLSIFVLSMIGCGGPVGSPPIKEQGPLDFDATDPERTLRWLIKFGGPVRDYSAAFHRQNSANPLRTDGIEAYEKVKLSWVSNVNSWSGSKIEWPVEVRKINLDSVEVDCTVKPITEDHIEAKVMFEQYPITFRDHYDGKLMIGKNITLAEAKLLNPGSRFTVCGVVDKIENHLADSSGYTDEYIIVKIKDAKAAIPVGANP